MASLIDGKAVAAGVRTNVASAVASLVKKHNYAPTLAVVLVGEDPASQVYVRNKHKFTREAGMRSLEHKLPEDVSEDVVLKLVKSLNADPSVDGILVQLPLPNHINTNRVISEIDPAKDVDGLTEISAGRLSLGRSGLRPCTPVGSVILAKHVLNAQGEDLSGKHCVIVGRSILVGKPAAFLFLEENCTVTIAHSLTKDLASVCRSADILVAAVGRPMMIKGDWIKKGAVVIDVGINRVPNKAKNAKRPTKLVGDVDYKAACEYASAITPVPGGVGPMTIACLLRNTVLAACARRGWDAPKSVL
ncbi:MAG: bifunctional methylenetetrahydrofolate dehydrogenase/methenyltetrahydrofolate cyclohydrolase FolD [Robiginitomaculum sp.]|nr:bifunctional methylenetetrahydrofolate dehydrogenase/methenyltetrahydrofolate cyclohydrolase FolD [Robiginitomaculum sp.]